jgi:tetratricopeptide (TPR) repeat protein
MSKNRRTKPTREAARTRTTAAAERAVREDEGARPRSRSTALGVALLLVVATCAVYAQVGGHRFVQYDDPDYVSSNPHVLAGLSAEGARWAFTSWHASNWHPLTWLSLMLDVELFGPSSGAIHLVNLALHAANVVLLLFALRELGLGLPSSALAAALFALHPLHVESVAWVAERKDVLSGFFFTSGLLAYAWYARERRLGRYLLVAAALGLGLLAKPMLVTFPAVLLLLDLWPLRRHEGIARLLLEKLPLFALVAASAAITVLAQRQGGAVVDLGGIPLAARLANTPVAYVTYLAKLVWPVGLAAYYPHPGLALPAWKTALATLLLAAISLLAWRERARRPWLAVGWAWFLGMLVPVIGLVQVGDQALADRYAYLPSIGIYAALACSLAELVSRRPAARPAVVTGAIAALAALALTTRAQVATWRDTRTLFEHALAVTGDDNDRAHQALGVVLADEERLYDRAIVHCRKAIELDPRRGALRSNLANALLGQGDFDGAIEAWRAAIELEPALVQAHYNLGTTLARKGSFDAALGPLAEAVRLDPTYVEARVNLAGVLLSLGRAREALPHLERALELAPAHLDALCNRALAERTLGETAAALASYREALAVDPGCAKARAGIEELSAPAR